MERKRAQINEKRKFKGMSVEMNSLSTVELKMPVNWIVLQFVHCALHLVIVASFGLCFNFKRICSLCVWYCLCCNCHAHDRHLSSMRRNVFLVAWMQRICYFDDRTGIQSFSSCTIFSVSATSLCVLLSLCVFVCWLFATRRLSVLGLQPAFSICNITFRRPYLTFRVVFHVLSIALSLSTRCFHFSGSPRIPTSTALPLFCLTWRFRHSDHFTQWDSFCSHLGLRRLSQCMNISRA